MCASGCTIYPTFAETDPFNRTVIWSAKGGRYYRRQAVSWPLMGDPSDDKEVTEVTFALALLRAHQQRRV